MSLGIHVAKISHVLEPPNKKRKTMLDAIKCDCETLNLTACQIFIQGPRNSHMSKMDYLAIKNYCMESKIKLYVHSSYITVGIFSVAPETKNTDKSKRAIKSVLDQFKSCDLLGSNGLVVHLSKRTPDEIWATLKVLIPKIKKFKTPLIFEQPAKKADGYKTYETPEKINKLNELIIKEFPNYKNWGWCIDTCHIWSAGINVSDVKIMKNWLMDINHPKKILLFHLNGGMKQYFGTGKDTHIIPFAVDDNIWHSYKSYTLTKIKKTSIGIIMKFAKINNIPCILEINRGSLIDSKYALKTISTLC
jgi:endonuclease IV